jgi:hypothetical protein
MLNKGLGHTVVHRPMGVQPNVYRNGLENMNYEKRREMVISP